MMRLFILGDSISIHYGVYISEILNTRFSVDRKRGIGQAMIDLDNPQGANGGDSSMVLEYLRENIDRIRCNNDILLLNCGLHDIKRDPQSMAIKINKNQYKENLEDIVDLLNNYNISTIWVRTTPVNDTTHNELQPEFKRFNEDVIEYNAIADIIMSKYNISMIDLYSFTQNSNQPLYCDHVHYADNVRREQAAYICGYVEAYTHYKTIGEVDE